MEDKRKEIIDFIIKTKLVETCVRYNTNKTSNHSIKEDLEQEAYLWLCEYDLDKLNNAYENKHLNALITRFVQNQWFSKTSPFYKKFKKFDLNSDEITQKELNIPDKPFDLKIY